MDFIVSALSHWENALAVVLVLGGLIFFHELGHFSVARMLGIGVRTFSLGFGPKLFTLRRGKTDYCLSLVPLGGYVALAGEEDGEGPAPAEGQGGGRSPLPTGRTLFGTSCMAPSAGGAGRPCGQLHSGPHHLLRLAWAQGQTYLLPVIGGVMPDSPAAAAGIRPGDAILSIDGRTVSMWNEVPEAIGAKQGAPVTIVLSRDGQEQTLTLAPESGTRPNAFGEEQPAWLIGISAPTDASHVGSLPLGPMDSLRGRRSAHLGHDRLHL